MRRFLAFVLIGGFTFGVRDSKGEWPVGNDPTLEISYLSLQIVGELQTVSNFEVETTLNALKEQKEKAGNAYSAAGATLLRSKKYLNDNLPRYLKTAERIHQLSQKLTEKDFERIKGAEIALEGGPVKVFQNLSAKLSSTLSTIKTGDASVHKSIMLLALTAIPIDEGIRHLDPTRPAFFPFFVQRIREKMGTEREAFTGGIFQRIRQAGLPLKPTAFKTEGVSVDFTPEPFSMLLRLAKQDEIEKGNLRNYLDLFDDVSDLVKKSESLEENAAVKAGLVGLEADLLSLKEDLMRELRADNGIQVRKFSELCARSTIAARFRLSEMSPVTWALSQEVETVNALVNWYIGSEGPFPSEILESEGRLMRRFADEGTLLSEKQRTLAREISTIISTAIQAGELGLTRAELGKLISLYRQLLLIT